MNLRLSAALLVGALSALLCACPNSNNGIDGGGGGNGLDGGNPPPIDGCSGGCGPTQICDTKTDPVTMAKRRECVDACGGCDAGTCTKTASGSFQCVVPVTTCSGNACEPGQIACLAGDCTCLSTINSAKDSCFSQGKWCVGTTCAPPKTLQECQTGGGACPTGNLCTPVFGDTTLPCGTDGVTCLCTKQCGMGLGNCNNGDLCSQEGCLPSGLFTDQECMQQLKLADGGTKKLTVPVSNTCLLKDSSGNPTEPMPSGNCTYAIFGFYDQGNYGFATCRAPGAAGLGATCKKDYSAGAIATTCGTGLECALTRGGDQGVCLPMCNAAPTYPGFSPSPACGAGESCANLYRFDDLNAVLGVCMKTCNVFDPTKNTCANVGTAPASCVPTTADGRFIVSTDGSGVCVPQQATIAAEGQPCNEQDAFKGAACGSGQVCASLDVTKPATCFAVCDTDCAKASPPARCATEPNATCSGGKTCVRTTSTTGAVLGFCK